ncbi:MAG: MotA/TolQ/ExbB proton channel family protein [Bdellovibrionales bacterium]|nr:MotA/TolQ/ExbB proton channel family protein [Bdellovibrionales bacterium]
MLPLLLCSLIALAVVVERLLWGPSRKRVIPKALEDEMRRLMAAGKYDELIGLCRGDKSPLARIILAVCRNAGRPRSEVLDIVQVTGKREALELQRYLSILGTIAAISPLLGLLGTVFGMIETFTVIESAGVGNAGALAGGISEALLTTAAGLTIAIPTLVFYRYFLQKTRKLVVEMETLAAEVLDTLVLAERSQVTGVVAPLGR